jgi:glutathione synthase/RimK-type ligase-like ATP-grasp enzyme
MRCAFLTLDDPTGYTIDDHLAAAPLARLGWSVEDVPWRRLGVDWSAYDAVVIRSTWDYAKDPDAFLGVLAAIARSGAVLLNPLDLVAWNIRKTYLRDLAARGVAIVPTVWRERLGRGDLRDLLDEVGSEEIVVKPVIGASARGAFRVTAATSAQVVAEIEAYYADRALMAQPFIHSIPTEGEFSLFYFDGEYSHTIRKTPKPADFRVQEEHGGANVATNATPELLAAGARVLRSLDDTPLYARVDFARANDASGCWLMELELIEPSLYLRMDAGAPGRFANALHRRVVTADGARSR